MTAAPSSTSAIPIDPRIRVIASGIAAAIPGAQIRLFGSRARGTSRSDSDVDLLITVPDEWLASQDRLRVLGDLWRQHSSCRSPLDLLLYSESEVSQHAQLMLALFGFRDSRIGFRLQQACEKALKGWIHAKGGQAPFTHDLVALMDWLEESGSNMSAFETIADLSFFAVQTR